MASRRLFADTFADEMRMIAAGQMCIRDRPKSESSPKAGLGFGAGFASALSPSTRDSNERKDVYKRQVYDAVGFGKCRTNNFPHGIGQIKGCLLYTSAAMFICLHVKVVCIAT